MATARKKASRKATAKEKAPTKKARALVLRKNWGMTQDKFSRVVGVKTRTLSKLEKGEKPTDPVRRRLTEVQRLQRALAELVHEDAIGPWMDEPNDEFAGLKPIEVIERGEIDRLWALIYDLRSGSPT